MINLIHEMMKKKILRLVLLAVIAICTTIGITNANRENEFTLSLILANTEALAAGEGFEYPTGYPYYTKCGVAISKHRTCKVEVIVCQGGGSGCNSKKCPQHS